VRSRTAGRETDAELHRDDRGRRRPRHRLAGAGGPRRRRPLDPGDHQGRAGRPDAGLHLRRRAPSRRQSSTTRRPPAPTATPSPAACRSPTTGAASRSSPPATAPGSSGSRASWPSTRPPRPSSAGCGRGCCRPCSATSGLSSSSAERSAAPSGQAATRRAQGSTGVQWQAEGGKQRGVLEADDHLDPVLGHHQSRFGAGASAEAPAHRRCESHRANGAVATARPGAGRVRPCRTTPP
jgi:hypothetical protein